MLKKIVLMLLLILSLLACSKAEPSKLIDGPKIDVVMNVIDVPVGVFRGGTPKMMLKDLPAETASILIEMQDLDVPIFPHGYFEIVYDLGGGDFLLESGEKPSSYRAPGPIKGHEYEYKVSAKNAEGKVIAQGMAIIVF